MKRRMLSLGIVLAFAAGLFAFSNFQSGITGKVAPADGAEAVWAISGSDTIKGTISDGAFNVSVKPGTYKLVVDAKDPYKDAVLENLQVTDQVLDVGEIQLQQ